MASVIRCTTCRTRFAWDPTQGMPDSCPKCDGSVGHKLGQNREEGDIVLPFIRASGKTASIDKVYRDMEQGSEVRAQVAAEMTGASASEMSDLKITDLRPTTRQGDIAAPPLPAHLQNVGSFGGGQAVEYGGAIQTGPHPNAGAHARTALQRHHEALTRGVATSERPALETQQPGYRIRG